jgi:phage baseplate assembly protein V
MSHTLTDLSRRMSNLIGLGTIAEVDHLSARVRVDLNGRKTAWLPVPAEIGANFIRWRPLRIGTQVLVACPAGDPANAIIVQFLYSAALPPPANRGDVDVIVFDDGTTIRHDSATHELTIISAGDLRLKAEGELWLDAQHIHVFEGG